MQIKDKEKYKKLIEIKKLAKIAELNPAKIFSLAKNNKIPSVRIHNNYYCSHELLDQGLININKTEPSLLSDKMRSYVHRLAHDSSYLEEALKKVDYKDNEEKISADPEEGVIAEWTNIIERKYQEIIDEIIKKSSIRKKSFYNLINNFKLQFKRAAFFISGKLESAKEQTIKKLSVRTYAVELAIIGIFVLFISVCLAYYYPSFTNIIVRANDKVFFAQVDFIEKNIIYNMAPGLAITESNQIIPDKEQLAEFIRRNSNKLFEPNSGKEDRFLITAEEIFGQVAGAEERK